MTDTIVVPEDVEVDYLNMPEDAYEEWVSHPNGHRFVRGRDHLQMANQQGWWALPALVSRDTLRQLGGKVEDLQPPKKKKA